MGDIEPLLSPEDIAELVGMNYHGVLREIRSGKLKATRKGKGYRVTRDWFEAWLEADVVTPRTQRPVAPAPRRRAPAPGSVERLRAIEAEEGRAA